jgi:DnaK suppressor protein
MIRAVDQAAARAICNPMYPKVSIGCVVAVLLLTSGSVMAQHPAPHDVYDSPRGPGGILIALGAGAVMTTKASRLDEPFIEKQRLHLTKLRAALVAAAQRDEAEEANIKSESGGAQEYEDDAQPLAMLELDGNLVVRDIQRLARVDRALKKIEEGSYGLSDISGQLIRRERLDAVPEAIFTLAEEEALEQKR